MGMHFHTVLKEITKMTNKEEIELDLDADDDDDVSEEEGLKPVEELSAAEQRRKAAQERLRAVRAKLSDARRKNDEDVIQENKRKFETPAQAAKRQRREHYEKEQELLKERGGSDDPKSEKAKLIKQLNVSAAAAEKKSFKKKKQKFDWDMYNDDAQARVYEKRVKSAGLTSEAAVDQYERQKDAMGEQDFYDQTSSLNYGQAPPVSDKAANQLVDELQRQAHKRSNFSRTRLEVDGDVDYINERNKKFNAKLSRAFGKYTQEIKDNLERGTAL